MTESEKNTRGGRFRSSATVSSVQHRDTSTTIRLLGAKRSLLPVSLVRGHEKVSTGGQLRSPLVATKSPHWWPGKVPALH